MDRTAHSSGLLGLGRAATAPAGPRPLRVTLHGPFVRGHTSLATLRTCLLAALAPSLAAALYNTGLQAGVAMSQHGLEALPGWRGDLPGTSGDGLAPTLLRGLAYLLPVFAIALITGGLWRFAFARLRRRPFGGMPVVTALVFTLILPPGAPLWQVALGMSFGVVIGKEIFGGAGKNFMHPALVGLAFLYLAYPNDPAAGPLWAGGASYGGTPLIAQVAGEGMPALLRAGVLWQDSFLGLEPGAMGMTSALACLIGAAVLIATGATSWRIMAGVTAGGIAATLILGSIGEGPIFALPWYWHLTLGGFAFGAVFLATEPASAAATNPGRWIYGLLIGAMIVLVRVANPAHPDGALMAVLLGNVFASLIDYGVMRANIRRRARRG